MLPSPKNKAREQKFKAVPELCIQYGVEQAFMPMHGTVSPYNFVDWRSQSQTFEQMATYEYNSVVLTGQKSPARGPAKFIVPSRQSIRRRQPDRHRKTPRPAQA
jgi:hypothetical protein